MKVGKLVGQGRTADIFEYGEGKVVKLFHKDFPENYIQYEYNVNKYLQDKLDFVPKIYDIIDHQNKKGIVYEKIAGISLLEFLMNNPLRLFKVTKQFVQLHIEMHKRRFIGFGTRKEYLRNEIERAKDLNDNNKKIILKYLETLPTSDSLCHNDFHPDNVMYTSKGLRVIDWITATAGNPASDVARTYYILRHGTPIGKLTLSDKIKVRLFQRIASNQYLKNYLKKSKISRKEIKNWELVTIASRLAENIEQEKPYILKRIKRILHNFNSI